MLPIYKESNKSQYMKSVLWIIPATSASDKPALSEEEMERKSKSIIDEFLHINDFKVNKNF